MYFLVTLNEDGGYWIQSFSDKSLLIDKLEQDARELNPCCQYQFKEYLAGYRDHSSSAIIIKGEIVVPKAIETATRFEVR